MLSFAPSPLYLCRIKDDLNERIPPLCDIDDIPDRCAGGRSNDSERPDITGHRTFIFRGEHAHLFQFFLQCLVFFIKRSPAVLYDLPCIELILAASLIDADRPEHDDLLAVRKTERQSGPVSGEHHTGDGSGFIF